MLHIGVHFLHINYSNFKYDFNIFHWLTGEEIRGNIEMGTNIETVVKKYEIEIWEFLEMLRSASDYNAEESKSRGWKVNSE